MLAFSCRGDLPSIADIEVLERHCGAIPLRGASYPTLTLWSEDMAYKNSMTSWQKMQKGFKWPLQMCGVALWLGQEWVMELDNLGGVKKAQAMYMKLDVVLWMAEQMRK
nr:hypothetical protein CFP56_70866 [Quercus suber]